MPILSVWLMPTIIPWHTEGNKGRSNFGVGFDDIEHCAWAGPPMTTVHQPFAEMGVAAAQLPNRPVATMST